MVEKGYIGNKRVKKLYWSEFGLELLTIVFIRCSCAFTSIETIYGTFPIFVHILLWFPIITIIFMWHYHVNNRENKNNEIWKYVKHNLNKTNKLATWQIRLANLWLNHQLTYLFPIHSFPKPYFSDVFRGYKNSVLGTNGLKRVPGQQWKQ